MITDSSLLYKVIPESVFIREGEWVQESSVQQHELIVDPASFQRPAYINIIINIFLFLSIAVRDYTRL